MNKAAETAWNAYAYKGEDSCPDIPWKADKGAAGVASTPYEDDAAEFRPAFKKVLSMATAYAAEGSNYYQNPDMLKDMTNIMDYLCTVCYTPKTQTNNWWTWEIGIPKDLIPILMLIYDSLTPEQVKLYTEAMYFFQPDLTTRELSERLVPMLMAIERLKALILLTVLPQLSAWVL